MLVLNLSHGVLAHESGFVYEPLDAVDVTFARVLPHGDVTVILQPWLTLCVLSNHDFVIVELAQKMAVVEVSASVDERFLLVVLFYQAKECEQRIAEDRIRKSGVSLNVNHRNEILLATQTLSCEIMQLLKLRRLRTVEMVRAHLQAIRISQFKVLLVFIVNFVSSFSRLDVYVSHSGVFANNLPEHFALVVADVNAVNVRTCVLALNILHLCLCCRWSEHGNECYTYI